METNCECPRPAAMRVKLGVSPFTPNIPLCETGSSEPAPRRSPSGEMGLSPPTETWRREACPTQGALGRAGPPGLAVGRRREDSCSAVGDQLSQRREEGNWAPQEKATNWVTWYFKK